MRERHHRSRHSGSFLSLTLQAAALVAATMVVAQSVSAQTVCGSQPWLGTNGPEMCIRIRDEGTGATIHRRVAGQTWTESAVVGSYRVALGFSYDIESGGMGVNIVGDAWRESPGSGWLSIRVDAGTDTPIPAGTGSLWLEGWANSASGATTGGGSGFRNPGGDVEFAGFPQVIELGTTGADSFQGDIVEIPIHHEQSVAVTNTTGLWVPEVGDQIHIPVRIGTGHEPLEFGEPARLWDNRTTTPGQEPWEVAGTALAGGDNPTLFGASISTDRTENLLHIVTIEPPYNTFNVTDYGVVDRGFVFDVDACLANVGHAVAPYINWGDTGPNLRYVDFEDGNLYVGEVEGTVGEDYYGVSCFKTADGMFFSALNATSPSIHIFKMVSKERYDRVATLDESDLGGVPTSVWFGTANGSAGSFETYGPGEGHEAVVVSGLADGTAVAAQIRTDSMEVTGMLNVGSADGETSADIYFNEAEQNRRAAMNWMNGGDAWHMSWDLNSGPASATTTIVGEIESGYLYDYQYISGFGTQDGGYYVVLDSSYRLSPDGLMKSAVTEQWSYPFGGMGGPVDLFPSEDSEYQGFALGPGGSLRLGMLKRAPEAADASVPAVARVRGAGAFFTTVMDLANAGEGGIGMEISYTPREGSGGSPKTINHIVPAGVMQTIEDPLETLFGFTGGGGYVGSLQVEVTSGSTSDLMLQTVVSARLGSGEEYGQFFPAMSPADAIQAGQKVYLNTTEDPVHNRVNIGLMGAAEGTRFRVTPMDPLGSALAAAKVIDLDDGGNTQINNLYSTFALGSAADVLVEVEVESGLGFTYASVLDGNGSYSGTSDPTTILPVPGGFEKVTLLEIGSIQGLNEFSGSASVTNYSDRPASVRAEFFQRGLGGVTATESLSIAAGDTVGFSDLGAELFGVSGDVGTVVLSTTNGTRIGATGREFAIFRDNTGQVIGTAGQLIAGQTSGERLEAGRVYHFIGLRQERGSGVVERSHFAVFNTATTDAQVTVRLFDGATGTLEGERTWIVSPKTLIQVNNVIRQINPDHDDGEKRIEVVVNRRVFMNAFRVNQWGDPVTLSPFTR